MSDVIVKKASYDYIALRRIIFEMMDALGAGEINSGARILIKPNFLCPAKPESGILTERGGISKSI